MLRLLLAVVSAAAGFWLITEPVSGTVTLTVILIWSFLAFGVLQLVASSATVSFRRGSLVALTGAVQIVLAVLRVSGATCPARRTGRSACWSASSLPSRASRI